MELEKLPVEVTFDNRTGEGTVKGGITIGLTIRLLAGTEEEIKIATESIRRSVTDELIKQAIVEIQRRVKTITPKNPTKDNIFGEYYFTPNIDKGKVIVLIHPSKMTDVLKKSGY